MGRSGSGHGGGWTLWWQQRWYRDAVVAVMLVAGRSGSWSRWYRESKGGGGTHWWRNTMVAAMVLAGRSGDGSRVVAGQI